MILLALKSATFHQRGNFRLCFPPSDNEHFCGIAMVGGLVAFFLVYLCALASAEQALLGLTRNPVLSPHVDAFISDILAEWNTPGGVSVAVVKKHSDGTWTVDTKGYGNASTDGQKMTGDSLFCIASNSKAS